MLSPFKEGIIATIIQAFLTGAYFASFLVCVRWLAFSDDGGTLRRRINMPLLITTVILFALSVTDFALSLKATSLSVQDDVTDFQLVDTGTITGFIELLSSIITDCVLIFRCWVVYNRSWLITIFPLLLLIYNMSSLFLITYWDVKPPGYVEKTEAVAGAYFASTIVLNIYATSAIVFQIWRNTLSRGPARFAIRVITESGLLYTLSSIATFSTVFFSAGSWMLITSAISFPMSGIAYNLILIRVAKSRAKPEGLPTMIGDSTFERAIPTISQRTLETPASAS